MTIPKFTISLGLRVIVFIVAALIIYKMIKQKGEDNPASKSAGLAVSLAAAVPGL